MIVTASDADGLPDAFEREELEKAGYVGWSPWSELRASGLAQVPKKAGCYVVFRPSGAPPTFLPHNPAGRFKGKDPTVHVGRMAREWVAGAHVVYVGKADDLRVRLSAYARFGAGQPVAHWGGRLIWQLAEADSLLVAWRPLTRPGTARELERRLLERFVELHGRRPLANLTG